MKPRFGKQEERNCDARRLGDRARLRCRHTTYSVQKHSFRNSRKPSGIGAIRHYRVPLQLRLAKGLQLLQGGCMHVLVAQPCPPIRLTQAFVHHLKAGSDPIGASKARLCRRQPGGLAAWRARGVEVVAMLSRCLLLFAARQLRTWCLDSGAIDQFHRDRLRLSGRQFTPKIAGFGCDATHTKTLDNASVPGVARQPTQPAALFDWSLV